MQRAQVMVDFFDNIEVLPGLHANGTLTLGENLADHGGLNVAYLAYKNATANAPLEDKDGFTPDQRFFLAYATTVSLQISASSWPTLPCGQAISATNRFVCIPSPTRTHWADGV